MANKSRPVGDGGERELVHRRIFAASREAVWTAFTDPVAIGHWWGPNGFTTTTEEMEVKPGGLESDLVQFRVAVSFADSSGATEVTMRLAFPTVELRETAIRVYGAEDGGRQTLERLAAFRGGN